MLWRLRREIILIFFILVGMLLLKHSPHFKFHYGRKASVPSAPSEVDNIILENERLRKILNLKQKSQFNLIYANAITISPWVFPTIINIDKGLRDGIKENMAIISYNGSLVGRIVSVKENTSSGITIYHPDNKISVIVRETGELAVMEPSSFSLQYVRINFLPSECKACVGNTVETSGLTKFYPQGIKIGVIKKVYISKAEPVAYALVKPLFINEDIRTVAIVK